MNASRRHRRGYILIVTIGLLVVAATVMVGVARSAIAQASKARQAELDLQQRWGATSIRVAVLPFAESILQSAEATQHRPISMLVSGIQLGGQSFVTIICDEQAKANVNALLDRASPGAVDARLRQSLAGKVASRLRLRPEPLPPAPRGPATAPSTQPVLAQQISGYGQVFDNILPADLISTHYAALSPVSMLTCWGSGAINLRRAPEAALRLALNPPMTNLDISRALETRNAAFTSSGSAPSAQSIAQTQPSSPGPVDPVRRLLSQAGVAPAAASRMSMSSSCHSLWIIAQSGGREWYYFTVMDESDPKQARIYSMRW